MTNSVTPVSAEAGRPRRLRTVWHASVLLLLLLAAGCTVGGGNGLPAIFRPDPRASDPAAIARVDPNLNQPDRELGSEAPRVEAVSASAPASTPRYRSLAPAREEPATATGTPGVLPAVGTAPVTATLGSPAPFLVSKASVNVRRGPCTDYPVVGTLAAAQYPVIGRNRDGTWLQIRYAGSPAWVFANLVTVGGDANLIGVAVGQVTRRFIGVRY